MRLIKALKIEVSSIEAKQEKNTTSNSKSQELLKGNCDDGNNNKQRNIRHNNFVCYVLDTRRKLMREGYSKTHIVLTC